MSRKHRKHRMLSSDYYELMDWYGEDPYEYYDYYQTKNKKENNTSVVPKFKVYPAIVLEDN